MIPVEFEGLAIDDCARHAEQLQRLIAADFGVPQTEEAPPLEETTQCRGYAEARAVGFSFIDLIKAKALARRA